MPHIRKSMGDDQKDGVPLPVYKVKRSLCELDGSLNDIGIIVCTCRSFLFFLILVTDAFQNLTCALVGWR